jgi:hypothetical protein
MNFMTPVLTLCLVFISQTLANEQIMSPTETLATSKVNRPEFPGKQLSVLRQVVDSISSNETHLAIKTLELLRDGKLSKETDQTLKGIIGLLNEGKPMSAKRAVKNLEELIRKAMLPILLTISDDGKCPSIWTPEQRERLEQASVLIKQNKLHPAMQVLIYLRREIPHQDGARILDRLVELIRNGNLIAAQEILHWLLSENRIVLMALSKILDVQHREILTDANRMIDAENIDIAYQLIQSLKWRFRGQVHVPIVRDLLADLSTVLHHLQIYLTSLNDHDLVIAQHEIRNILMNY